jgi:hypothetical protein
MARAAMPMFSPNCGLTNTTRGAGPRFWSFVLSVPAIKASNYAKAKPEANFRHIDEALLKNATRACNVGFHKVTSPIELIGHQTEETDMKSKLAIVAISLLAFSLPALAATTEFYVAKNQATKKCEVSDKKPDGKTMMMIGKDMFKTKVEAETAMKAAADCK